MKIRFAVPGDAPALLRIYAQYMETPITFEYVLPSPDEFAERIADISACYPYLVCEEDTAIVGYAYAHRYGEREAYQWGAELSIYLDRDYTSNGLGKTMYCMLIDMLKAQGIRTVYGAVTSPNIKSEALHNALGFHILGVYHNAGYKKGKWHDVVWYEKQIAPYEEEPQAVISIAEVPGEELQKIISCSVSKS